MSKTFRDQLQSTLGDGYAIERELGGGGMSQVFVVEEKALGRRIVVKVLPLETRAEVSVERFKREIQVAARLQHPHIVPVLTAGEVNGQPYYTMPFVRGDSLRARLSRGGELSVNETMHLLRDIASALAYAHGEGVVHRDIKPDNVIVSGGVAVVTDFGVSKAVDLAAAEGDGQSSGITSLGIALGTPAYMSPEQASADPRVDHRADIYSFGCLAYEVLAGSSPFAGRPPQQMLAAQVSEVPEPLLKRRPNIPPMLASLVMKCLEKRPGDRPQSADEVIASLDGIATPSAGQIAPVTGRVAVAKGKRSLWFVAIGSLAALFLIAAILRARQAHAVYSPGATTPVAVTTDLEYQPAISPDGKIVAFVVETTSGPRIFVQQIDGGRAAMLTSEVAGQHHPSWSPDQSKIAFSAKGAIYTIPSLPGSSPKLVIERGKWPSWSPDSRSILYSDSTGLWLFPLNGNGAKKIQSGAHLHSAALSPDGRLVVYADGREPVFTNISASSIWVMPVSGGAPTRISDSTHVNLSPVWTPDGRSILYVSNAAGQRDVVEQRIDSDGRPVDVPVRITTALGSFGISLSANGLRLAYDVIRNNSNVFESDIAATATTPTGISSARQITHENQHIESVDLSADGKWLVYDSDRDGTAHIYKTRVDSGAPVQLTTGADADFAPAWSPDGKWIAFHTSRNGNRRIYIVSSEGNQPERVTEGPGDDYFPGWSADGSRLIFARSNGLTSQYMVVSRSAAGRWSAPAKVALTDGTPGLLGRWSPEGDLLALNSSDGVVLLKPAASPRVVVTPQQVGQVLSLAWGRDDKSVYAFAGNAGGGGIWRVELNGSPPRKLLTDEPGFRFGRWSFATDGSRIFFTRGAWESDVWVMDLRR